MEKRKRRYGWLRKIFIVLLLIFVVIQFIRPAKNEGDANGPADITHLVNVPPDVMKLLVVSCYDCHSNHTEYPWYSQINPVGWWLNNHIKDGKRGLNFTEFASYPLKKQKHRMNDIAELVKNGEMPLDSYTWIHKDAILTEAQKQAIIDWSDAAEKELDVIKPVQ